MSGMFNNGYIKYRKRLMNIYKIQILKNLKNYLKILKQLALWENLKKVMLII